MPYSRRSSNAWCRRCEPMRVPEKHLQWRSSERHGFGYLTDARKRTIGGSIVPAVHQRHIVVRLSCLVSALSLALLTGCLLDLDRWASDRQKPKVVFAIPAAWRCDRQKSPVPTAEG